MPAYSFQKQFAEPILAGTKGGTIRAQRRAPATVRGRAFTRAYECGGHAYPGETLYLFTGMRTKHCQRIGEKTCVTVEPITLDLIGPSVSLHRSGIVIGASQSLDDFAVFDGFESWEALWLFWLQTHGREVIRFEGWHIRWLPLPPAIAERARQMEPFVNA